MSIKLNRAIKLYDGFKGDTTIGAITEQIPQELITKLTGSELALVMKVIDKAYHTGRASTGAEMIDSNCVWINSLQKAIEWNEVGAEYNRIETTEQIDNKSVNVIKSVKTKDGKLTVKFHEE